MVKSKTENTKSFQSKKHEHINIIETPNFNEAICFTNVESFFSLTISGNIPTSAMYKNPPLVNGSIHDVILPAFSAELNESANIEPDTPANAVVSYNK